MNKTTFWHKIVLLMWGALATILLISCSEEPSTSPLVNQSESLVNVTVVDVEPTPVPTQPLPNITVQELYNIDEESPDTSNISDPYPVENNSLPAPVIQETFDQPVSPTPDPLLAAYPIETDEGVSEVSDGTAVVVEAPEAIVPIATPPRLPQTSAEDHYWMIRPIAEGGVVWTDKFYPYGSNRGGTLRTHHGVEFSVGAYDVPILAVADGRVVFAGADDQELIGPELDFYGNVVVIEHGFGYEGQPVYSLYAHLNGVTVGTGQEVNVGDVVGLSGASGVADAVHLHFEVRVGANNYESTRNPGLWLWPFPEDGTIAGRVLFPDGTFATDYPVSIHKIDPGEHPVITQNSYADDAVNGDDRWPENFLFDDVEAGRYEVYAKIGTKEYNVEVVVEPRRTAYVEIVIGE